MFSIARLRKLSVSKHSHLPASCFQLTLFVMSDSLTDCYVDSDLMRDV